VLSKDGIEKFTSKVIPFLHVTTKIPGKKYDDLLLKNHFGGFPTLAFMDAEGKILTTLHYTKRSIEGFEETLRQVSRLQDLRSRAETDPQAAKDLLFLELDMKTLRYAAARERAKGMDFTKAERLAYETALVETLSRLGLEKATAEVAKLSLQPGPKARAQEILSDLQINKELRPLMRGYRPGVDPEPPYHLALGLYHRGLLPSDKPNLNSLYWSGVSRAAFKTKDIQAFEAALKRLRGAFSKSNPQWIQNLETQLSTLSKEAVKKN